MKKRIISILLLWFCAFIPAFPLRYWSYAYAASDPALAAILLYGSTVLDYAVIIVVGIAIGKRLRASTAGSNGLGRTTERLIFLVILWLVYYFSNSYINVLVVVESLGATNITSVDYLHMSAARVFIYELLFAPSGFFALILSYATIALTLSKKKTVPAQ